MKKGLQQKKWNKRKQIKKIESKTKNDVLELGEHGVHLGLMPVLDCHEVQ